MHTSDHGGPDGRPPSSAGEDILRRDPTELTDDEVVQWLVAYTPAEVAAFQRGDRAEVERLASLWSRWSAAYAAAYKAAVEKGDLDEIDRLDKQYRDGLAKTAPGVELPETRREEIRGLQESFLSNPSKEHERSLRESLQFFSASGKFVREEDVFTPELYAEVAAKKRHLREEAETGIAGVLAAEQVGNSTLQHAARDRAFNAIRDLTPHWEGFSDVAEPIVDKLWESFPEIKTWEGRNVLLFAFSSDPRPVGAARLLELLKHDPDWRVRSGAAKSLASSVNRRGKEAVDGLIEAMRNDPHEIVRQDAAGALAAYAENARLHQEPDFGALQAALDPSAPKSVEEPEAVARALDPKVPDQAARLERFATSDPSPIVRATAVERLTCQPERGPNVIRTILGALANDADSSVRRRAAYVMGFDGIIQRPEIQSALRHAAAQDPAPEVVRQAQASLEKLNSTDD